MASLRDLEKLLRVTAKKMPEITMQIIEREGEAFIQHNFKNEGFDTGNGVQKWQERKTTDKRGRDITRYRSNRRGKKGTLNKYGRSIQNRSLLVGYNTGGDKLKNSYKGYRKNRNTVAFRTYKPYAQSHNEGLNRMPKRQHIGRSKYFDKRLYNKIKQQYDKHLK